MDQAAYLRAREAANTLLIACWLSYCARPEEALRTRFQGAQLRLQQAAIYAQQQSWAVAVGALAESCPFPSKSC